MKALVYTDIEKVVYKDYEDPKLKTNESIIKVVASGICGSDMHAYHGKDERRVPPLILGHEISGIVKQGKNEGEKVIINPLISCGDCKFCNLKSEHLCPNRALIGMNKPFIREGGLAEYVSVPDKNIYKLPIELDINKAAISEPAAVSLHAIELGEKNLKMSIKDAEILIIGGGAIGILCALILENIKHNNKLTLLENNKNRSKVCEQNIKSKVKNSSSKDLTENSFDFIIDAVGTEKTRELGVKLAKPGSTIVHAGLTNSDGKFNFRKLTLQEIIFIGTYCYTVKDFMNTINFLKIDTIGDLNWIEFRQLKNGAEAFKQIHNGTCSAPKIILLP